MDLENDESDNSLGSSDFEISDQDVSYLPFTIKKFM